MDKVIKFIKVSAGGIVISFFMFFIIFLYQRRIPYELFLQQAIPFYGYEAGFMYKVLFEQDYKNALRNDIKNVFKNNSEPEQDDEDDGEIEQDVKSQDIEEKELEENKDSEKHLTEANEIKSNYKLDAEEMDRLKDVSYLKGKFYVCDKKTDLTKSDFDVNQFLSEDTSIKYDFENHDTETIPVSNNVKDEQKKIADKPQILIFHTHSTELFKDSKDISEGVLALGDKLAEILKGKYKINVMHHTKSYDIVDGKPNKRGAYERMEPEILKIINENPSLEVAIDIHRDGVADTTHLVENINNKPTAKIMFVNGLCKLKKENKLEPIENLSNPYLKTNLAFSFKMQLAAYNMYPKLVRKIYLNAYRYSLNMLPKSLLVEVGAQTNSKQEALNAMEPLADILATVLLAR